MQFTYHDFSCATERYNLDEKSFVVKFFNVKGEPSENEISDYVLVDPGYGYLCLKFKGTDALLSGFLDEKVFKDESMINAAIEYVEALSPNSDSAYIPHNVIKFRSVGSVEYNGEF